jgi:hypothetical protein
MEVWFNQRYIYVHHPNFDYTGLFADLKLSHYMVLCSSSWHHLYWSNLSLKKIRQVRHPMKKPESLRIFEAALLMRVGVGLFFWRQCSGNSKPRRFGSQRWFRVKLRIYGWSLAGQNMVSQSFLKHIGISITGILGEDTWSPVYFLGLVVSISNKLTR